MPGGLHHLAWMLLLIACGTLIAGDASAGDGNNINGLQTRRNTRVIRTNNVSKGYDKHEEAPSRVRRSHRRSHTYPDGSPSLPSYGDADGDSCISEEEFLGDVDCQCNSDYIGPVGGPCVECDANRHFMQLKALMAPGDRDCVTEEVYEIDALFPHAVDFAQLDTDQDGILSREEWAQAWEASLGDVAPEVMNELFDEMDLNKDGRVSREEFIDMHNAILLRLDSLGIESMPTPSWLTPDYGDGPPPSCELIGCYNEYDFNGDSCISHVEFMLASSCCSIDERCVCDTNFICYYGDKQGVCPCYFDPTTDMNAGCSDDFRAMARGDNCVTREEWETYHRQERERILMGPMNTEIFWSLRMQVILPYAAVEFTDEVQTAFRVGIAAAAESGCSAAYHAAGHDPTRYSLLTECSLYGKEYVNTTINQGERRRVLAVRLPSTKIASRRDSATEAIKVDVSIGVINEESCNRLLNSEYMKKDLLNQELKKVGVSLISEISESPKCQLGDLTTIQEEPATLTMGGPWGVVGLTVGLTFVFTCFVWFAMKNLPDSPRMLQENYARLFLVQDCADCCLDWVSWAGTSREGDLEFSNDKDGVVSGFIVFISVLGSVFFLADLFSFFSNQKKLNKYILILRFGIEDFSQAIIYSFVLASQAGGTWGSALGVGQSSIFCALKIIEIFFMVKEATEEARKDDPESKDTTNKTATATPDTAGPRVPQPSPKVPGGHSQSQSSGTTNKTAGMPQSPPTGAPAVKMTTSPPVAQYKGMTPMGMGGMPPMGAMGGMPMGGMPRPMGGMPMGMGGMPMYR